VGLIYEQFERELSVWRTKYAAHPGREMILLFLLALEREEIVSVGYRESAIMSRLSSMPISVEVREIIRHALIWAWKDEEMHAIYIRGAILKLGNPLLRLRAFMTQAAGAVGGWSSSVRQHARWSEAPLSRLWATLFTWAGQLSGKVPKDVKKHLDYGPFRNFCLFNVDAEKTAWLCWHRLVELAQSQGVSSEMVEDFRRIEADEERHRQIFEILAAALDDQDQLVPEETADSLAKKLGTVGEFFLPRSRRSLTISDNPLGSGGNVVVISGNGAQEKLPLFRRLLDESGLSQKISERARAIGKQIGDMRIAVKPTFMLGYHHKDMSPITDPELLEELALWLQKLGCRDIVFVEGPNIYDRFYHNRSVQEVADYFKLRSSNYRIVDVSKEQVPHSYYRGMGQYTVGQTWKEADFRISFPKMRSHPIELAYLTVGNVEWIGGRCDEFIFVERQARRETAIMMLVSDFPPHFAILDAYEQVPDGLLGVMGCPRPKSVRRFYAGADALAVDMVAARHLGVKDPHESSLLRAACHWFGNSPEQIKVIGINEPIRGWRGPYYNELSTILSFLAYPVYVFGSGRGSLFVPEMDEKAFPLIEREGILLKLVRRGVQAFLGLRHPK
jgi:uncharacterized protein (DUF362 family)